MRSTPRGELRICTSLSVCRPMLHTLSVSFLSAQLADGLRQDHDDAIPLQYARCPSPLLNGLDSEQEQGSEDGEEDESHLDFLPNGADMDVGSSPLRAGAKRPPSRPSTPPLPLSPISNPSSPPRKRPRTSNWDPPEHIPDFLPPFPTVSDDVPVEPVDVAPVPHVPQPSMFGASTIAETQPEKTSATLAQSLTTAAASDFLVQVPYSQSALSSVPEWHLPSAPQSSSSAQPRPPPHLPIPIPEQTLIKAYHYILTNPPPKELPPLNPSRHKVALALIQQTQSNPRFNPADSLFGTVAPCPPRVATIGPSHPVAIGDRKGEGNDKDTKLPVAASRPVAAIERTAPFISQQTSRIPELAHLVLPPAILTRTSRLTHPPVLHRGTKPLTYGSGIAAPWNANPVASAPDAIPPTPLTSKPKDTPTTNGRDTPAKPILPDARLYATWDYETKDFRMPLAPPPRGRGRMGSMQASGSGVNSLPVASRNKGIK
ncbi:hypothetical protein M413DRAFT_444944 [Hebeloma cylindrosporum]|uniref:Uncharacterized protein n=1 Tax=Hebeloma cylindrosporum TaxID=76867 RepID=A0A0C2YL11_HEBCY|nr:hypothetical protein M413DRAFT_444944 [Hebeloma cylindrosporum h7]